MNKTTTLPTFQHCVDNNVIKGQLAEELYPHLSFDSAIQQDVCYQLSEVAGRNVSWELITAYPDGSISGVLLPLTKDMADFLRNKVPNPDPACQLRSWALCGLYPTQFGNYLVDASSPEPTSLIPDDLIQDISSVVHYYWKEEAKDFMSGEGSKHPSSPIFGPMTRLSKWLDQNEIHKVVGQPPNGRVD